MIYGDAQVLILKQYSSFSDDDCTYLLKYGRQGFQKAKGMITDGKGLMVGHLIDRGGRGVGSE